MKFRGRLFNVFFSALFAVCCLIFGMRVICVSECLLRTTTQMLYQSSFLMLCFNNFTLAELFCVYNSGGYSIFNSYYDASVVWKWEVWGKCVLMGVYPAAFFLFNFVFLSFWFQKDIWLISFFSFPVKTNMCINGIFMHMLLVCMHLIFVAISFFLVSVLVFFYYSWVLFSDIVLYFSEFVFGFSIFCFSLLILAVFAIAFVYALVLFFFLCK